MRPLRASLRLSAVGKTPRSSHCAHNHAAHQPALPPGGGGDHHPPPKDVRHGPMSSSNLSLSVVINPPPRAYGTGQRRSKSGSCPLCRRNPSSNSFRLSLPGERISGRLRNRPENIQTDPKIRHCYGGKDFGSTSTPTRKHPDRPENPSLLWGKRFRVDLMISPAEDLSS